MTKENLLPNSALMATAGDPKARDRLLRQTYGIKAHELAQVRDSSPLDERVVLAAELLLAKAQDITPGAESSQLTTLTLAAIASDSWDKPRSRRSSLDRAVKDRYQSEALDTRLRNIPNIHFLRDEVGAYSGNLFEAEKVYPNFQTSKDDFLKSTTLPLEITPEHAYMLGVIWSAALIRDTSGILATVIADYKDPINPEMKKQRFRYLETLIDPIFDMFNLNEKITAIPERRPKIVQVTRGDRTFEATRKAYPQIEIGSRAACTWLIDDIGLYTPDRRPNLLVNEKGKVLTNLDIFPDREHMLYFIAGIIDQIASVGVGYNKISETHFPYARHKLRDPNMVETINNLKRQLSTPTVENQGEIYFPARLMRGLLAQELIRNPNHLKKLAKYDL